MMLNIRSVFSLSAVLALLVLQANVQADDVHPTQEAFLAQYCGSCHSGEGEYVDDFSLDTVSRDETDPDFYAQWDEIRAQIDVGSMPPDDAEARPSDAQRDLYLTQAATELASAIEFAPLGGTTFRRLNRIEYINSVRDVLSVDTIQLPLSFPSDDTESQFDTNPDGLYLSATHLEGYMAVAAEAADHMVYIPTSDPIRMPAYPDTVGTGSTKGVVTQTNEEGVVALCFSGLTGSSRGAGGFWVAGFKAEDHGLYRVSFRGRAEAAEGADGRPLRLVFYAYDLARAGSQRNLRMEDTRKVGEFDITNLEMGEFVCDIPLHRGEQFQVYCVNRFDEDRFSDGDPGGHLKRVKGLQDPTVMFEEMVVEGPVGMMPRQAEFIGEIPAAGEERAAFERILFPLARRAFRRPLSDEQKEQLVDIAMQQCANGQPFKDAVHYSIRYILCSTSFLYREAEEGILDDHALASRLSYFLWSTTPDEELMALADQQQLSNDEVLSAQVSRMLADPRASDFIVNFSGQWLGNRDLEDITINDERYQWLDSTRYGVMRSTEMFFEEILTNNLKVRNFIDSDFTYANEPMLIAWGAETEMPFSHYQKKKKLMPEPVRINFADRPSEPAVHWEQRGGLLGLTGIMAISSNGTESSPILRGVWVLENFLGFNLPTPPENVPPIDEEASVGRSIREIVALHTSLETCASCHVKIDPLGLALENFDPVGGWRDHYPATPQNQGDNGRRRGRDRDREPRLGEAVDPIATMDGGFELTGPNSIKQYLLERPYMFTRCIASKLFEYGAGREPSPGDMRVIDQVVDNEPEEGYGLQDLIVQIVLSEAFKTK